MVGRCARAIGAGRVQGEDKGGGEMRVVLGRARGEAEEVRVVVGRGGCRSGRASPVC